MSVKQRVLADFYVQILTAEVHLKKGNMSQVEDSLPLRSVRRFWNEVAHSSKDDFVRTCVRRTLRCLADASLHIDHNAVPLIETIIGGTLFGTTSTEEARSMVAVVLYSTAVQGRANLHAGLRMLRGVFRRCISAANVVAAMQSRPQVCHFVARTFVVYEQLLHKVVLDASGVETILRADIFSDGVVLCDLLRASWQAHIPDDALRDTLRSWALRATAAVCLASPSHCVTLLPALTTACFVERPIISLISLGLLWDLSFLHAPLGATISEEEEVRGGLQFLLGFEGSVEQRGVTVYGVCRLLLHGVSRAPEYLVAKVARMATEGDDHVLSVVTQFFTLFAKDEAKQEAIADGVVQLAVEAQGAASGTPASHPALRFLVQWVRPHIFPAIVSAISRNLKDFFGTSPDDEAITSWLVGA